MKEETRELLEKAERAMRATRTLLDAEDAEFAAGRVYYAMFYVAEALLHERGLRFSKHQGVHGAFGKEFAKGGLLDPKYHRWLLDAFDTRIEADYGVRCTANLGDATAMLSQAQEFLAAARDHLGKQDERRAKKDTKE